MRMTRDRRAREVQENEIKTGATRHVAPQRRRGRNEKETRKDRGGTRVRSDEKTAVNNEEDRRDEGEGEGEREREGEGEREGVVDEREKKFWLSGLLFVHLGLKGGFSVLPRLDWPTRWAAPPWHVIAADMSRAILIKGGYY